MTILTMRRISHQLIKWVSKLFIPLLILFMSIIFILTILAYMNTSSFIYALFPDICNLDSRNSFFISQLSFSSVNYIQVYILIELLVSLFLIIKKTPYVLIIYIIGNSSILFQIYNHQIKGISNFKTAFVNLDCNSSKTIIAFYDELNVFIGTSANCYFFLSILLLINFAILVVPYLKKVIVNEYFRIK